MEQLPLILPAVTMNGTAAGCDSSRRNYDLHADLAHGGILPVGYAPLPDSFTMDSIAFAVQSPWVVPGNFYGRISVGIDTQSQYTKEVGFTDGIEDGHPRFLKALGYLNLYPNLTPAFIDAKPCIYGSTTYHKGDRLLIAPETNDVNIGILQVFIALLIKTSLTSFPLESGVVHAIPTNLSSVGGAPACIRSLVSHVSQGGNLWRVHYTAREHGLNMAHASIGVQNGSTSSMVSTPVPLTFNGAPNLVLPAYGSAWSDWVTLPVSAGQSLLIDQNFIGGWPYKNISEPGFNTWFSSTASYNNKDIQGAVSCQPDGNLFLYPRTHGFDCVQVQ